jgi:hypothetical protein
LIETDGSSETAFTLTQRFDIPGGSPFPRAFGSFGVCGRRATYRKILHLFLQPKGGIR